MPVLRRARRWALAILSRPLPGMVLAMGFIPATGGHDFHWLPSALPPEIAGRAQQERADRSRARIERILSLACTALAIYDLFLLASGA